MNTNVYNSSVKQIPGGSANSTTFLGVLIFSLIIWMRSGKKHMLTSVMQRGWILTIPEPRGFWDYFPRLAPIPEGIPGVRGLGDFPGDPRQIHSRPLWP